MNTFKKVLRWFPVVTIVLVAIMAIGTVCGNDYSWSSDKGSLVKAISAQFGHSSWSHFLNNAGMFAMFGIPAELLFKKKKWYIAAISVAIVPQMVVSYFGWARNGMGASGWVTSILGILAAAVCVAAIRNVRNIDGEGNMGVSFAVVMPILIGVFLLVQEVGKNNAPRVAGDISHYAMHIVGYAIGLTIAFVAVVSWIITLIVNYRRNK
jgi:hypothetical protein